MKKVALSLLAFGLAAALGFAQDAPTLKLSGSFNTGAQTTIIDGTTETILWESDSDKATRIRLNGAFENANSGVKFRLQSTDMFDTTPSVAWGYAWSKFADGLVTVLAGKMDTGTFETAGDNGADYDGIGAQINVMPMEGLNAGVVLFYDESGDQTKVAFQSAYSTDLFSVQLGVGVSPSEDDDGDGSLTATSAHFGGAFKGVAGLKLAADGKIGDLGRSSEAADYSDISLLSLSQIVEYAVSDAISVGLLAYEYVYGADATEVSTPLAVLDPDADATLFGYFVQGYGSYKLNEVVTIGGKVKYLVGSQGVAYDDLGNTDGTGGRFNAASEIIAKPYLSFTVGPNATIETSLRYFMSLDDEKLFYGVNDDGDPISNAIVTNVDFRYSF